VQPPSNQRDVAASVDPYVAGRWSLLAEIAGAQHVPETQVPRAIARRGRGFLDAALGESEEG
jgi:hypothetical protein